MTYEEINNKYLEDLKQEYIGCTRCSTCLNNRKVFGYGKSTSRIAVIGEGPGRDEVDQGKPFVGAAGQLFSKILASIGIDINEIYLTNSVICRTNDKNRTPNQTEIENCRQRLHKELSIVNPKFTLLVGTVALQTIFGNGHGITKDHGQWITTLSKPCYFYFPIYHPAWILHSATDGEKKQKKLVMWHDIKKFKEGIEALSDFNTDEEHAK
jgi:DNA polymerase